MATKKNLSTKAKYVPNRMINEIEVERNGKTTTIDGADLLDGAYVKKGVKYGIGGFLAGVGVGAVAKHYYDKNKGAKGKKKKFGNGGGVAVSSESGLAFGTNAELLMNEQNLRYEDGGRMGTWCYEIGGL